MSDSVQSVPPDPNEEINTLREELARVRAERDRFLNAWIKLTCTDDILKFTNEEILACVGREPSLRDLIAEIENDPE